MAFEVVRSAAADADIEAIFDHLVGSQLSLGHDLKTALDLAETRIQRLQMVMERLGRAPMQGTRRDKIMNGLRSVTKDKVIFYFTVDEAREQLRVMAIFFGGQDHLTHIVKRLKRLPD